MKGNYTVRLLALVVLGSVLAAHFNGQVNIMEPTWLWLTIFAGLNALQSTFTGFCPVEKFLPKTSS
jgi:hypothetical protein